MYYLQEVLKHEGEDIEGKRIALSGYGNVAWGIMKKATELGAKVTYYVRPRRLYPRSRRRQHRGEAQLHSGDARQGPHALQALRRQVRLSSSVPGEKPWGVKDVDVNMPSAMQNDVHMDSAKKIAASGVKYYIEVANMPTTNDALNFLQAQKHMIVAPSKAVNAGGVAVSALEMAQNSERLVWTAEEVDAKLHRA